MGAERKKIIVVGCGRLGSNIACKLSVKGYYVIIIDKKSNSFRKIPESFSGYQLVADATDVDVLESAGINEALMVIATTDIDNVNILIANIASKIYGINKIYIRLDDVEKGKLITDSNINAIYPYKLSINQFEKLSLITLGEE